MADQENAVKEPVESQEDVESTPVGGPEDVSSDPPAEPQAEKEEQTAEEPSTEEAPPSEEPKEEQTKPEKPAQPEEPAKQEEPEEPAAKPEEPSQPEEPASQPEEPAAKPEEPAQPEEPSAKPEEPAQPEEPSAKPEEPPVVVKREKVWCVSPSEGVDLAMEREGPGSLPPITVGEMFQETYQTWPNRPALCYKEDGEWKPVTYSQYYSNCLAAAKSFRKLGLQRFGAVAIIGFNSPEWFYSNMGAMFAGGMSAGIYTTNGPEACHFIANDCKANIIVVENQKQLDKILQIRDQLPDLNAIVQYKGKLSQQYEKVYDWEQFIELGKDVENSEIEDIMKAQKPTEAALLIYTSGTTGTPKGVMISHDNLTFTSRVLLEHEAKAVNWIRGMPARLVTYLPLSHIAGQMADIYLPLHAVATVYFAQPDALKGSIRATMAEVKPTLFFGVPRVYEKFMEAMQQLASTVTGIKKKLGMWATGKGYQGNVNIQNKQSVPWGWTLANALVLDKVKARIGLQEFKVLHVGAAPIHQDVIKFFMRYNLPVLELYGMSENTGPATLNIITDWRLGSVGKPLLGTKLKLDNMDENGEGEICMYGRHVCMGYLNSEKKTREAIDEEGWLHSGDIGRIDKDGFYFITGRIKELIITSGGENIAPVPIEDRIKATVPFLSNIMLLGDKRKYLACLVTLKCVMDPDSGEPKDELLPQAAEQLRALGCDLTKPSEIAKQRPEAVVKQIQAGLDKANKNAVSNAQKVQKFAILETDFSIPGGELGPTLKLKRRVVVSKYEDVIDALYTQTQPPPPQAEAAAAAAPEGAEPEKPVEPEKPAEPEPEKPAEPEPEPEKLEGGEEESEKPKEAEPEPEPPKEQESEAAKEEVAAL